MINDAIVDISDSYEIKIYEHKSGREFLIAISNFIKNHEFS